MKTRKYNYRKESRTVTYGAVISASIRIVRCKRDPTGSQEGNEVNADSLHVKETEFIDAD